MHPLKIYCLLVVVGLCAILFSCKKAAEEKKPSDPPFTIANLQDITIRNNSFTIVDMPVDLRAGQQEKVTLRLDSLPSGITATPDSITGRPTFHPRFTLSSRWAYPGIYPISVGVRTESGRQDKYSINLIVQPTDSCGKLLSGKYYQTTSTHERKVYGNYLAEIEATETPNIARVKCSCKEYYDIKATVYCEVKTIVIPEQEAAPWGHTVKGVGYILDSNIIVLNYTYTYATSGNSYVYTDTIR